MKTSEKRKKTGNSPKSSKTAENSRKQLKAVENSWKEKENVYPPLLSTGGRRTIFVFFYFVEIHEEAIEHEWREMKTARDRRKHLKMAENNGQQLKTDKNG